MANSFFASSTAAAFLLILVLNCKVSGQLPTPFRCCTAHRYEIFSALKLFLEPSFPVPFSFSLLPLLSPSHSSLLLSCLFSFRTLHHDLLFRTQVRVYDEYLPILFVI